MFYDKFSKLCDLKGVSCKRAAMEIGLSNSIAAKWKRTGATPNGETLAKIAEYFGVPVGELLDHEIRVKNITQLPQDDRWTQIMFALSKGGQKEITEEMFEEVKKFAEYIGSRESGNT